MKQFMQGHKATILAASAARTAALTVSKAYSRGRGLILIINVTARAAATTLTPKIQLVDPVSGEALDLWTAAAAINTADGTFAYLLYPLAEPTADYYTEQAALIVPPSYNLVVTPSDANSVTYSVAAFEVS